MKALVTGGRGFIGSHLVDALVERDDDVTVLDNGSGGDNHNDGATYFPGDPITSAGFTEFDVVFHTAAISRTPHAIADPVLCWETNLMLSVRLLEACRRAEVPRVVLSSSNIVYAGITPYRASKLAMEEAATVYNDLYGLSAICLRYSNAYGPRQREDGIGPNVFPALRKSLQEKGYIEVTGDGEQRRQFTHVRDIVRANLLAAESEVSGNYDITTGVSHSLNQIAELIRAEVKYLPPREGDVDDIYQDPELARKVLGFQAEIPLEEGIKDCFPVLV